MKQTLLILLGAAALAGCASTGPEGPSGPSGGGEAFNTQDFAWSTASGGDSIDGVMTYKGGAYTCAGSDVVLAPETPWSRARMRILYGSDSQAAVLVSDVKSRTPSAPSGDYTQFARHSTCDAASHFSFSGLPDGTWFVITVATPVAGGDKVAVMRRADTRGGGERHITLN
jgi:hypothetical protein